MAKDGRPDPDFWKRGADLALGTPMGEAQCNMCGGTKPYFKREEDMAFWICDDCWATRLTDPSVTIPPRVLARVLARQLPL